MSNESSNHNIRQPAAALADAQAVNLARASAFAHCNQHPYLPQTHEQANTWQPHEWVVAAIHTAALMASQPVGATVKNSLTVDGGQVPVAQGPAYNAAGISLTACQLHEALLMAGDPELDVPFEDRGQVRIFWMDAGHSGPGVYCECVDAEEEGCILLDGTAPALRQTAQAVEMSPDFTDTARAAIAWVLWHHQGGSSPVGQPLRFALGMGQHDRLTDRQVAEAKRFAAFAGATTDGFHHHKAAQAVDLGPVRAALEAAEGLAVVCASVDGYSREEIAANGQAMRQQFADARALIDSKAVGNG